jgi:hypothetical protein
MPNLTLAAVVRGRLPALLLLVGLLMLLATILAGLDPAVSHQVGSWRWQPSG